jgi:AcrR family transcriptional regulator
MNLRESQMTAVRRTQEERREETQRAVLQAGCHVFGEKGYANAALEDIAREAGVTIRPIYHYFGNKQNLFAAVTEQLERHLVEALELSIKSDKESLVESGWQAFMTMSCSKHFRQIVLIDAPNILGKERWAASSVVLKVKEILFEIKPDMRGQRGDLISRMLIAALAEAALMSTEMDAGAMTAQEIGRLIQGIIKLL